MRSGYALWVGLCVAACGAQRTSTQTPVEGANAAGAPSGAASAIEQPRAAASSTAPPGAAASANAGDATGSGAKGSAETAPVSVATAKAHSDGKHYALDVKAPGVVTVGGHGELEIVLVAKDGYHINDAYPYKLKTASNPSAIVTFDNPELPRSAGVYTKTEARFVAKFAGAAAGDAKIGGTMTLSVCTKKECIVDKVELEVPIVVR